MAKFNLPGKIDHQKMAMFGVNYVRSPMLRMGVNAGIAGGVGVAASAFDREDDTVVSALGKGVKAAALEYFVEEAIIMSAQTQLATRGVPTTLLKAGTKNLGLGPKGQNLLHNAINGAVKSKVKLPKGKLVTSGIGAGVGLAWTMMNGDTEGMLGTLGNMAVGAGIGLMGKEVYDHVKKEPHSVTNHYKKKITDFLDSKHGKLIQSNIQNFMASDVGKLVGEKTQKVMQTPHGKAVTAQIDNILDGNLHNLASQDIDKLMANASKVHEDFTKSMNDPRIAKELKKYPTSPQGQAANKEMAKYIQGYVNSIGKNISDASEKIVKFTEQYRNDPKLLERHAKEFMEGNAKQFSDIVKQFGGNIDDLDKNLKAVSSEVKRFQDVVGNGKYSVGDMIEEAATSLENLEEKGVTVKHFSHKKVKEDAKATMSKEVEVKKIKNNLTKMKVAGAIGLTAFAAASVMDSHKENQQDVRVGRMKAEQEKNLTRQTDREKEVMSQFQYGGPSDFGSIAFDMFNQRIGHHLMGNAKFQ